MLDFECVIGADVWAAFGPRAWRPACIIGEHFSVRGRRYRVAFIGGDCRREGWRECWQLRPRYPARRGTDKPGLAPRFVCSARKENDHA